MDRLKTLLGDSFSRKQLELIAFAALPTEGDYSNMVCAVGAIRSGKTHAGTLAFFLYTQSIGPLAGDVYHLVLGRKFDTSKRTILEHLKDFASQLELPYSWQGTDRVLEIDGVKYKFFASENALSEVAVMGYTAHSILADESTNHSEGFFLKALGRATFKDSKVWVLCNPGHPSHFLKKQFVDEGLFAEVLNFTFEDNPILSEEAKERFRRTYKGALAKRLVDGKWAAETGAIYPEYHLVAGLPRDVGLEWLDVAIDPGYAVPYGGLFIFKQARGGYIIHDEYYHRPEDGPRTPAEHARAIALKRNGLGSSFPGSWLIDPAAAGDRAQYAQYGLHLAPVDKDLLAGINNLRVQLENGNYIIAERCENLITELDGYVWAAGKEKDLPEDKDNHLLDALRYHCSHRFPLNSFAAYLPSIPRGR